MTISIFDIHPIQLHPVLDTQGDLSDVHHDNVMFSSEQDKLFDELRTHTSAEVELHDGATFDTHVWETLADGTQSKWARDTSSSPSRSVSGPREEMTSELTVVVVAPGTSVPQEGPPPPGTTNKKINVKIRKQGGLPI